MGLFEIVNVPLGIGGETISFNYCGLRTGDSYVQTVRKLEELDKFAKKDNETKTTISSLFNKAKKQMVSEPKELVERINKEHLSFDLITYITKSDYKIKNKFFMMDYFFKSFLDEIKKTDKKEFSTIIRLVNFDNKLTETYGTINPSIYSIENKENILILSDYVSMYKLATIAYLLKDQGIENINIISLEKVEI